MTWLNLTETGTKCKLKLSHYQDHNKIKYPDCACRTKEMKTFWSKDAIFTTINPVVL